MIHFDEIEPALAHFVFAHEALRHSEGRRQLRLREAFLDTKDAQQFSEDFVFGRENGLGHLPTLQPKVEYPNMGNRVAIPNSRLSTRSTSLAESVKRLARKLRLPQHLLEEHRLRLPDGSLHYTPRFRWCILIKAIIEHFCAAFVPGGVVLYIGDTENKFVHKETEGLTALGVTLDSAAKIPDVIVHDTKRNWLLLIEAVTSAGPVDGKRRKELKDLFAGCKAGLVFVTAFESRKAMQSFISHIAWESEVWIAEDPDHMIHFNGERFLGPYPDVMPTM